MEMMEFVVGELNSGDRLDSFLAESISSQDSKYKTVSRSQAQKLLRSGAVSHNGKVLKPASKLRAGDTIIVQVPNEYSATPTKPTEKAQTMTIEPEKIPLEVIFEDDDLLVVNKPKGMAVHGAPETETRTTGTLVNALLYHCMDNEGLVHLSSEYEDHFFRPGIVHRIDRQTSGILVIAKTMEAHMGLKEQFEHHTIIRKYNCLCHGVPAKSNGRINSIIGRHPTVRTRQAILQDLSDCPTENLEMIAQGNTKGKLAKSAWAKLDSFTLPLEDNAKMLSLTHQVGLMEFQLFTGRTHQIRAQMQRMGHPLLFDPLYRTSTRKKTQLHLPVKQTNQEKYILKELQWEEMDLYKDSETTVTEDPIKNIGQFLHASALYFNHPTQYIPMKFEAPHPPYFLHVLNILRKLK